MPQWRRVISRNCARYRCVGVMIVVQLFAVILIIGTLTKKDEVDYEQRAVENYLKSHLRIENDYDNNILLNKQDDIPISYNAPEGQADWQSVNGSNSKLFVYSAFFVPRLAQTIKVIAVGKTNSITHVFCRLYDAESELMYEVVGFLTSFSENSNFRYDYSPCFVVCLLPKDAASFPRFVSVAADIDGNKSYATSDSLLPIHYPTQKPWKDRIEFAICVKPKQDFGNIEEHSYQFLEWIEFHKLMGVEKFTFYNYNGEFSRKFWCRMKGVYGKELITLLPWTLSTEIGPNEIKDGGSAAALTDCVLRYRGVSDFILILSLDEMLVPRQNIPIPNYSELMRRIGKDINVVGYNFQQGVYYREWKTDVGEKEFKLQYGMKTGYFEPALMNLVTFVNTRRTEIPRDLLQGGFVYICRPEWVKETGDYFVWNTDSVQYRVKYLSPRYAAVNHYHSCSKQGCELYGQDMSTVTVVDNAAHAFIKKLIPKVTRAIQKLKRLTNRC